LERYIIDYSTIQQKINQTLPDELKGNCHFNKGIAALTEYYIIYQISIEEMKLSKESFKFGQSLQRARYPGQGDVGRNHVSQGNINYGEDRNQGLVTKFMYDNDVVSFRTITGPTSQYANLNQLKEFSVLLNLNTANLVNRQQSTFEFPPELTKSYTAVQIQKMVMDFGVIVLHDSYLKLKRQIESFQIDDMEVEMLRSISANVSEELYDCSTS